MNHPEPDRQDNADTGINTRNLPVGPTIIGLPLLEYLLLSR
jgi:hypothetical protein